MVGKARGESHSDSRRAHQRYCDTWYPAILRNHYGREAAGEATVRNRRAGLRMGRRGTTIRAPERIGGQPKNDDRGEQDPERTSH